MDRRLIGDTKLAPAFGYAHGVEITGAQRLLFLSGQVPVAPDGTVPTGIEAQTLQVWSNIIGHLGAADMTLDNLVKVTVYLSDRSHRTQVNDDSDAIMGDRLIAWTTIMAGIIRDAWLLEIEAIAAS
jgi:2-iminobutanoate/2-iminopropanoate deaminase